MSQSEAPRLRVKWSVGYSGSGRGICLAEGYLRCRAEVGRLIKSHLDSQSRRPVRHEHRLMAGGMHHGTFRNSLCIVARLHLYHGNGELEWFDAVRSLFGDREELEA